MRDITLSFTLPDYADLLTVSRRANGWYVLLTAVPAATAGLGSSTAPTLHEAVQLAIANLQASQLETARLLIGAARRPPASLSLEDLGL